jgi:hypothetical protein
LLNTAIGNTVIGKIGNREHSNRKHAVGIIDKCPPGNTAIGNTVIGNRK